MLLQNKRIKMKLLAKLSLLTICVVSLNAQTTMCFKENHTKMSTIESIKLDGGMCDSKFSAKEMNKNGWSTSDIKINGNNYIYVFKKTTDLANVDMEKLEQRVLQKIELKNKKEKEEKRVKQEKGRILSGKKIYQSQCVDCHGKNGEIRASGSTAINTFSLKEFEQSLRGYLTDEKVNNPSAILMIPYAKIIDSTDTKNIYVYLQSLKEKKEEPKVEKEDKK